MKNLCIFMLVAGGRRTYILLFANMTLSINKYVYFYCTGTIRIELSVSLVGYTCLQLFCKTICTIFLFAPFVCFVLYIKFGNFIEIAYERGSIQFLCIIKSNYPNSEKKKKIICQIRNSRDN